MPRQTPRAEPSPTAETRLNTYVLELIPVFDGLIDAQTDVIEVFGELPGQTERF